MDAANLQAALDGLAALTSAQPVLAVYARSTLRCAAPQVLLRRMPSDAAAAAHALFAVLRALDDLGVEQIWVEAPPNEALWDGVRDRLQRASA
jgi:L-threonylcarbamoyladenylate synthase